MISRRHNHFLSRTNMTSYYTTSGRFWPVWYNIARSDCSQKVEHYRYSDNILLPQNEHLGSLYLIILKSRSLTISSKGDKSIFLHFDNMCTKVWSKVNHSHVHAYNIPYLPVIHRLLYYSVFNTWNWNFYAKIFATKHPIHSA